MRRHAPATAPSEREALGKNTEIFQTDTDSREEKIGPLFSIAEMPIEKKMFFKFEQTKLFIFVRHLPRVAQSAEL